MELYKIDSPSGREHEMSVFITDFLATNSIRFRTDECGNIYATKGDAEHYPCVVAHMDEVHQRKPKGYRPINFKGEVIFGYDIYRKKFVGTGADDKNGIWICLKLLKSEPVLKCVFFVQEEVGRIGSGRCHMSFFDDCRYVLQCDRRGDDDFITRIEGTELCSQEFIEDALEKSYGYGTTDGLVTDVYTLKRRGLNVSCANISCGYYNPHTDDEFTRISDLRKCLKFVRNIIANCNTLYPHTFTWHDRFQHYGRRTYNYYEDFERYPPF